MRDLSLKIVSTVNELFKEQVQVELVRTKPEFGDFTTNIAMRLAKKLNQNPREIAQQIIDNLKSENITKLEVAGPGFINITLADDSLVRLAEMAPAKQRSDTVVIETNNPNLFKAMHIGHGMNAVVADTVANLIEADGAHVYRVSYHGDVGLHVGKSMYSLLKFVDGDISKLDGVESGERNSFMSRMYAEGSKAYKNDPQAKAEIDELAKQSFTREDKVYCGVYDTCRAWSFEQIDQIVARLGSKPTIERFLESDADVHGVAIVRENVPKVFQESDGAIIFPGSKFGAFDNVFVSSSGMGLYGARDLGLMELKKEQYHPDKSYIITAEEQGAYFRGVLAAAAQIWPDRADVTVNISTGTVKLSTGKMSSRDGDVIEIAWLFDEFKKAIEARGGTATDEIIAGALRYQFLKVKIGSDIIFDINEAVSLTGSTGSYLQYAHARATSILVKSSSSHDLSLSQGSSLQYGERLLVSKLGEYSEVVERACLELQPHLICTYLYELCQTFNRFYEKNRVIGDEREALRLALVKLYADKLKTGLDLLGITAPDKM